jgi:hypothetical protein
MLVAGTVPMRIVFVFDKVLLKIKLNLSDLSVSLRLGVGRGILNIPLFYFVFQNKV